MKKISIKNSLSVFLLVFVILTGCGVKGNPVIPSNVSQNEPIIYNLKANAADNAVILNGDFYFKNKNVGFLTLEKSELDSDGNECQKRSRVFERIGQISVKNAIQESKEYIKFTFIDNKIMKGKTYNYILLVCDDHNECRKISMVEIDVK